MHMMVQHIGKECSQGIHFGSNDGDFVQGDLIECAICTFGRFHAGLDEVTLMPGGVSS